MAKRIVKCKSTSEYWETVEGRTGEVTKEYFYNGELHIAGTWADTGEKFDLPSVFLED